MDPNLFHLDWERLIEVLTTVVVLSVFLERALAVIFESQLWIYNRYPMRPFREPIALLAAFAICHYLNFDALSMIVLTSHTHWLGETVTAAVIAGGSKLSVKLFRDMLHVRSSAYIKLQEQDDTDKNNSSEPFDLKSPPNAYSTPGEPPGELTLFELMQQAKVALKSVNIAWISLGVNSEIDPNQENDPFGTLPTRWRIAEAMWAEKLFKELEEIWDLLKNSVERAMGTSRPSLAALEILLKEARKLEKKPGKKEKAPSALSEKPEIGAPNTATDLIATGDGRDKSDQQQGEQS